jgi:oxalate decarboxylase
MHWHPNADEWQYYIAGQGAMTVFNTGPKVVTQNFKPGDIGYVKRNLGHYILIINTGDTDLAFLEVFRSNHFEDVSLSDWLAHTPHSLVAQHLNVEPSVVARFPNNKPEIMPE